MSVERKSPSYPPEAFGPLSTWGWGYADRFPGLDGRRALGSQVAALLGFEGSEPVDPVPLEHVIMPASRAPTPPSRLVEQASDARRDRALHAYGRAYRDVVRGFCGDYRGAPDLVALPRSEQDVVAWLDWCDEHGLPVVPFGGGTSVVGGVELDPREAAGPWVSLDLRGLGEVLEVDDVSLLARIQAGATGPALERTLGECGLTLRHYPQSYEFSTLGGWIATRSAGHYATGPTHIDERVAGLRAVSPAGPYESRSLPGSGAGPSPDRLWIGSEGALGVLTEAWMRVVRRPTWLARASARFEDYWDGVDASRALAQSGLQPANCRLLDGREAALFGVSFDRKAVLLLSFESADHPVGVLLDRAMAIVRDHGGVIDEHSARVEQRASTAGDPASDHGAWRTAFVDAPYLVNTMVSLSVIADTFETACSWSAFRGLHAAVVAAVRSAMKDACGRGFVSCRFTHVYPDGPAPYFTFVAPGRRGAELEQWAQIKHAASEALLAHGGTITHHHAVGRLHRPWYERQRSPLFGAALAAAKHVFDPGGIMNPGALLPVSPSLRS